MIISLGLFKIITYITVKLMITADEGVDLCAGNVEPESDDMILNYEKRFFINCLSPALYGIARSHISELRLRVDIRA